MNNAVKAAASAIVNHLPDRARLAIVLGSGLGSLVEDLDRPVRIDFKSIPGYPVSTVSGHRGELIGGRLFGTRLLALSGRVHCYEGYDIDQVVFPFQVMAALGVQTVILTNAAGAINESFRVGDFVVIKDHINSMGMRPRQGSTPLQDAPSARCQRLRQLAYLTAKELGIDLRSGVYVGYSGPSYETPAEIRAFRTLGGDLVGMSAVPELLAARGLGLSVLALSLVTNMAAGVDGQRLSHEQVIEKSARALPEFKRLVKAIIKKIIDTRPVGAEP